MDPNTGKKGMFNKLSKEQGLALLEKEDFSRKTVSFYRYVILDAPFNSLAIFFNLFVSAIVFYFNISNVYVLAVNGCLGLWQLLETSSSDLQT